MAVTLDDLKAHLNVDSDEDDALLTRKLDVAREIIGEKIGGYDQFIDTIPAPVDEAILMYAGHLYANREATTYGGQAFILPLGVDDLIGPWKFVWKY